MSLHFGALLKKGKFQSKICKLSPPKVNKVPTKRSVALRSLILFDKLIAYIITFFSTQSILPVLAHLVTRLFSSLATRCLTDLMRVPCPVGAGFTSFAELPLPSLIGLMDARVVFPGRCWFSLYTSISDWPIHRFLQSLIGLMYLLYLPHAEFVQDIIYSSRQRLCAYL